MSDNQLDPILCPDSEFDHHLNTIDDSVLLTVISKLQLEMGLEQEKFNGLNEKVNNMKDLDLPVGDKGLEESSIDLLTSQKRLTFLMERCIKSFSQQSLNTASKAHYEASQSIEIQHANPDSSDGQPLFKSSLLSKTAQRKQKKVSFAPKSVTNFYDEEDSSEEGDLSPAVGHQLEKELEAAETNNNEDIVKNNGELVVSIEELPEPDITRDARISESKNSTEAIPIASFNQIAQSGPAAAIVQTENEIPSIVLEDANSIDDIVFSLEKMEKELEKNFEKMTDDSIALQREVVDVSEPIQYQSEYVEDMGHDGSGLVQQRVTLIDWDPVLLLKEMYKVSEMKDESRVESFYINMEGYISRLPPRKRRQTLLKTWKRKYFKALNGYLYIGEDSSSQPTEQLLLMGGRVDVFKNLMLGVDDGSGHYIIVQCPSQKEFELWKNSLETQIKENFSDTFVRPLLKSLPRIKDKVIIIDLGSSAVRAGVLGEQVAMPTVYAPCIAAINKKSKTVVFASAAYEPHNRKTCRLEPPISATNEIERYKIKQDLLPGLFQFIFDELGVNPTEYRVMMSTPYNLPVRTKQLFFSVLFDKFHVRSICTEQQSILSMYLYNASTGVIVDIGQRVNILPIIDGYTIEQGISQMAYGGRHTADALNLYLTEDKFHFFSAVEYLLVQYVMQKACFVSQNYLEDLRSCQLNRNMYSKKVELTGFQMPKDTVDKVEIDACRFKAPEGLFNLEVWGLDLAGVHKLVYKAIHSCSIDERRAMCRNIYLSGGATMFPGFIQRLQSELENIVPETVSIKVHGSPARMHAAYIGASVVAAHEQFAQMSVSNEDWQIEGAKVLQR